MSDSTIRPLSPQPFGVRVKSSSVPTSTLPVLTPDAFTEPSVGRPELCISITGCAVPSSPCTLGSSHATPPPATRIGSNGVARRTRFWYGSRCLPEVA